MIILKKLNKTLVNIKSIQNLLENAPQYSLIISGQLPLSNEGEEVFTEIPPSLNPKNKIVMGVFFNNKIIGVIDYLIGYPNSETIYLGLLLLSENQQSKKLGKKSYDILEKKFSKLNGFSIIRLSVVEKNLRGINFWLKMGFVFTGEKKIYTNKCTTCNVLLMEKKLY
jgi:ribosomal protein S18 acetylase RimI-like enzyme